MHFISIDPGNPTGVSVFDHDGKHITTGTVKYNGYQDYTETLKKIAENHTILFALIEDFVQFRSGRKARGYNNFKGATQLQLCKEIFENHVLVHTMQWNPRRYSAWMKKQLIEDLGIKARNEHERDSALMGVNIFKKVQLATGGRAFDSLFALSKEGKRFPRRIEPVPWIN